MQYQFSKDFCSVIRLDDGVIVKFDDSDPNKAEFDEWALTSLPLQPDYSLEELQEANKDAPIIPIQRVLQWYEDAFVDKPELIEGLWVRMTKSIDLREDSTKLEELRTRYLEFLANFRWEHEVGGCQFNGVNLETDDKSQFKITGVYTKAQQYPETSIPWKTPTGWSVLQAENIIAVGNAIFEHVQRCFQKEYDYTLLINSATTVDELLSIDVTQGWEV